MSFNVSCVILCGGKSRRMGENKSLLPFGGKDSLAEYQLEKLKPYFLETYISCKNSSIYNFEAEFIEDESSEFNPFNGILSSFNYTGMPYLFFLPVDTPLISIESIEKILQANSCSKDGAIAKTKSDTHNLVGIYSNSVVPKIESMIKEGDFRVRNLIKSMDFIEVEFESEDEFVNLNYKDEYNRVLRK